MVSTPGCGPGSTGSIPVSHPINMKLKGIKCNVCSDIIYARHVNDTHWCSCTNTMILTGRLMLGKTGEEVEIDLQENEETLYMDWALGLDKLGVILGYETDSRDQEVLALHSSRV